jgi:hypothetical protein
MTDIFDDATEDNASLAECQAREKVLRDALDSFYVNDFQFSDVWGSLKTPKEIDAALALPSDSTALDAMLKQAKREALLEAAAGFVKNNQVDADGGWAVEELRRMAKELE